MKLNRIQFLLGILLVIIGVSVLALPYYPWGLMGDDFAFAWRGQFHSVADVMGFFRDTSVYNILHGDNFIPLASNFFSVLYRPLLFFWYGIQHQFFGFSPYGYLIVQALLHGVNAVLFFRILLSLWPTRIAFIGALYFLLHVSFLNWFGCVTNQQHALALFFVLVAGIAYQYYVKNKSYWFLVLASLALFCAIFTRETFIIFPVVLLLYGCFYKRDLFHNPSLLLAGLLPSVVAFAVRFYRFPFQCSADDVSSLTRNSFSLVHFVKERFISYVCWIVDATNLGFVPSGDRVRKGTLIILIVMLLVWLFWRCTKKKDVLFCMMAVLIICWPAIVRVYISRFFYEALPFFIAGLLFLLFSNREYLRTKFCVLSMLVLLNGVFLVASMQQRNHLLQTVGNSFTLLIEDLKSVTGLHKLQSICFVGLPGDFCAGTAQACYIYGLSPDTKIYYDKGTYVAKGLFDACLPDSIYTDFLESGLRITLKKPLNFVCSDYHVSFGLKERKETDEEVVMLWRMDDARFERPKILITWDFQVNKFVILNEAISE